MINARRLQFCQWALQQLDATVLMSAKGDFWVDPRGQVQRLGIGDQPVFDCSGLVTCAIRAVIGKDHRDTHNAQRLWDEMPAVTEPEPGDLGFFGSDAKNVIHVVISLSGGHVLSADGATRAVSTLAGARARGAKVRVHQRVEFYRSAPFLGWKRNTYLDKSEDVTK